MYLTDVLIVKYWVSACYELMWSIINQFAATNAEVAMETPFELKKMNKVKKHTYSFMKIFMKTHIYELE